MGSHRSRATALVLLVVLGVSACDGSQETTASPTPTQSPLTDSEWAVPSLPPSDAVDDDEALAYVRILQEAVAAGRSDDCDALTDLAEGSPNIVEQSGDFCQTYLPGLAQLDLAQGTLIFRGAEQDNLTSDIGKFSSRAGSIDVAERDGELRITRISVGRES